MLAIFHDQMAAIGVVPQLVKAGIDPTSIEYMDNPNVRTTSEYLEFPGAPHIEDGIYVIITIETFNEDELDMKWSRPAISARQQALWMFWRLMSVSGRCAATVWNL